MSDAVICFVNMAQSKVLYSPVSLDLKSGIPDETDIPAPGKQNRIGCVISSAIHQSHRNQLPVMTKTLLDLLMDNTTSSHVVKSFNFLRY